MRCGERIYRINAFRQLNSISGFEIGQIPATACIMIGANQAVPPPNDARCTGGIFYDNRAVASTAGPFWADPITHFEVRYTDPTIGQKIDLLLGTCTVLENQCRVRLDV